MPPVIVNLAATTELEALNAMLASIGEAPYDDTSDFSGGNSADAQMALNILRDVCREVQSEGWKFNTEFGYEVAPAAQYNWVDTGGTTTALNIFTPPAGMIGFKVTQISGQQGWNEVDTEIRPSRKYTPGTQVFYDRRRSRDGFEAAVFPYLYINPIWLFDFEDIPQTARAYILYSAGRRFQASVVGSQTLYSFTKEDEIAALRRLKREQGTKDRFSMIRTGDVRRARGGRPDNDTGFVDIRKNRNTT